MVLITRITGENNFRRHYPTSVRFTIYILLHTQDDPAPRDFLEFEPMGREKICQGRDR